ncbi:MAG: AMP-binding protein [Cytophagales bacterium]|nr:AMP-binding protein [Cytophagales bacterium]
MPQSIASAQIDSFVRDGLPPPEQWPQLHYEFAQNVCHTQLNLVAELLDQCHERGFAEHPLLRSPSTVLTYAQTRDQVNRIAHVLTTDLGLVPGNRVLLRGGNSIGLALAWLAVVKAGLIAVATMPLLRATELCGIIDIAKPTVALCDINLIDELALAQGQQGEHPSLHTLITFNAPQDLAGLEARAAQKSSDFQACPTLGSDIALMAFTSGTTGKPKAAVHTHQDVLAACEAWPRFVLEAKPSDIVFGSPPLAFTFGLGGLLIFPMWAGASVYFHDAPLKPQTVIDTINQVGITICYTAPTMYRQLAPIAAACGVPSLRTSVSAGEALPDATRQLWKAATGLEMLDGIGATEMFHIFISSKGEDVRAGAIGKVVPGYTAKVVDDAGQELPIGTIGKLAVIGPTGCKYFNDPRQKNYVKAGWNYPGDAFRMDADGYFYYQARDDDMIITAGYNVGAPEVEDALLKHPAVAECGVIGEPDLERGMTIHAFCVLKETDMAGEAMKKTLQDHVKTIIAPYKYPRRITFMDKLPRTETGKLQRFKLRTFYASTTTTT